MKKMSNVGDLVKCTWLDAFGSVTEDYTQEDIDKAKPMVMTTYGILVRDDRSIGGVEGVIGLAAETCEGRYRGVTFIPVSIVVVVETARASRQKKSKANNLSPSHDNVNTLST